jgi:uncharacterized protein (DUF2267 family)
MQITELRLKVQSLSFIPDTQTADSLIKAVLGHLASRMNERQARELTRGLPASLSYATLRGRQLGEANISTAQFREDIRRQFGLDDDQTAQAIGIITHVLKEEFPEQTIRQWEDRLPEDWALLLDQV